MVDLTHVTVPGDPAAFTFNAAETALLMIDMQGDFLCPGGFGEMLGNDVSQLAPAIAVCEDLLKLCRRLGMSIIHTREGHLPDLSDLPVNKQRGPEGGRIGDIGPMGRYLVRGEPGHDIVAELAPQDSEVVIDKCGKGAFYATPLADTLQDLGVRKLIVSGVTTEVCVHTTVREANDRGYDCLVVGDACGSYFPEFHRVGLAMIAAQGGIFGTVCTWQNFRQGLAEPGA